MAVITNFCNCFRKIFIIDKKSDSEKCSVDKSLTFMLVFINVSLILVHAYGVNAFNFVHI